MKHPKKPVGLAVGLAPKKGVLESGVFPTFLQNLFCLLMTLKLSFGMTPCKREGRKSIRINPQLAVHKRKRLLLEQEIYVNM